LRSSRTPIWRFWLLAREGYGADVVSAGEMDRALAAGIPAEGVVFSGVGKTADELTRGVKAGIGQFNIESEEEGVELAAIAAARPDGAGGLRVNPDVDAGTHAKIPPAWRKTSSAWHDRAAGIGAPFGAAGHSDARPCRPYRQPVIELQPLEDAFTKMGELMRSIRAQGLSITHMDLGGGIGVPYKAVKCSRSGRICRHGGAVTADWGVTLMFEPGRVIAGNSGVLVTEVVREGRRQHALRHRRCGDE
jgi:diaminopimelate decarboxylase